MACSPGHVNLKGFSLFNVEVSSTFNYLDSGVGDLSVGMPCPVTPKGFSVIFFFLFFFFLRLILFFGWGDKTNGDIYIFLFLFLFFFEYICLFGIMVEKWDDE